MTRIKENPIERYRQGEQALAHVVAVSASIRRHDSARMGPDVERHLDDWDRSHRVDSDEVSNERPDTLPRN